MRWGGTRFPTVQLSDPTSYTGGEFVFHDLEKSFPSDGDKVKMKNRGTAIMFPSFIFHSVEPVLTGIRYGLTAVSRIGLIAQEVQEIVPEVVTLGEDGYLTIAYPRLTALLVEAIKELSEEIKELRISN